MFQKHEDERPIRGKRQESEKNSNKKEKRKEPAERAYPTKRIIPADLKASQRKRSYVSSTEMIVLE